MSTITRVTVATVAFLATLLAGVGIGAAIASSMGDAPAPTIAQVVSLDRCFAAAAASEHQDSATLACTETSGEAVYRAWVDWNTTCATAKWDRDHAKNGMARDAAAKRYAVTCA